MPYWRTREQRGEQQKQALPPWLLPWLLPLVLVLVVVVAVLPGPVAIALASVVVLPGLGWVLAQLRRNRDDRERIYPLIRNDWLLHPRRDNDSQHRNDRFL